MQMPGLLSTATFSCPSALNLGYYFQTKFPPPMIVSTSQSVNTGLNMEPVETLDVSFAQDKVSFESLLLHYTAVMFSSPGLAQGGMACIVFCHTQDQYAIASNIALTNPGITVLHSNMFIVRLNDYCGVALR
ncbi:hypothetical protein HK101_009993, partial [Irineochytrium annulatum]